MTTEPTEPPAPAGAESAKSICAQVFEAFARGDLADFQAIFHPRRRQPRIG